MARSKENHQRHSLAGKVIDIYRMCRKSGSSFLVVSLKYVFHRIFHGQALLLHQKVKLRGAGRIHAGGRLEVGINYNGISYRSDKTLLNILGKLDVEESASIGRGCRLDIGEFGSVSFGRDVVVNCNTTLIIMHHLEIGDQCRIGWDCQFLDEDFHTLSYPGQKETAENIIIGNRVWIGCGVKIYKGTVIPGGCVVASDSVVKGIYTKERALIGGVPARVLKEDVDWS